MDRRTLLIGSAALIAGLPRPTAAQPRPRRAVVGRLSPISKPADEKMMAALRDGLREFGWVDGHNLDFVFAYAHGQIDRLGDAAAALLRHKLDILVVGSTPGALAAKRATSSVPIVFVTTGDPVAGGLVDSMARPSGNLTGIAALGQGLNGKRLQLFKEMLPRAKCVLVLGNLASRYTHEFYKEHRALESLLGLALVPIMVESLEQIGGALARPDASGADAVLILPDVLFLSNPARIVAQTNERRLATICPDPEFVRHGGLMFYGAGLPRMYHHAATFVHRILKGAQPGDLPVEQPTQFELLVNAKTAAAFGITLPPSFLIRADEVIE